jgi:membrane-associated protease RseP (regulator of RpoE activity)
MAWGLPGGADRGRAVVDAFTVFIVYLAAWTLLTTVAYAVGLYREGKVTISPLLVAFKSSFTFESFEKLRGNRAVALLLDAGIAIMIIVMAGAYYTLLKGLYTSLSTGQRVGVVTPIIPGVTIGLRTFLELLPGLIVAVITHEAFHALAARFEGIRVRSTGLMVLLGIIPAAFVEPDEEELEKAPRRSKLRVYSAGVLANTLLFLLFASLLAGLSAGGNYIVIKTVPGTPASEASVPSTLVVKEIVVNGTPTETLASFVKFMAQLREKYGDLSHVALVVEFVTPEGQVYRVVKPRGEHYIGINLYEVPRSLLVLGPEAATWVFVILLYAELINIGLAGINAIPIFISDGAQYVRALLEPRLGRERAQTVSNLASAVTLLLLVPNLAI